MYEVGVGDSPMRIAHKLSGNPYRYGELLAANPHKSIAHVNGRPTFESLRQGERLIVPSGFVGFVGATLRPLVGHSNGDRLNAGGALTPGQSIVSPSGKYELVLQTDGNCVLYNRDPAAADHALWDSGTYKGCRGVRATMQSDGNFVVYGLANGKATQACWSSRTNGKGGVVLVMQDDGNLVIYDKQNHAVWSSRTQGGRRPPKDDSGGIFSDISDAISKVPVLGDVAHIVSEAVVAPINVASAIASGARLDHVFVDSLKAQLKIVKDVAPYAQTVVSFVPGIGTGVAAAIAAGAALAEGQSISDATKAAVRAAIPGGALAQAGFDAAMRVASGENVGQVALESGRALIPSEAGKKAYDIAVAVATGEKLQTALAKGLIAIAPGQLQTVLDAGAKAVAFTPALATAFKSISPGAAEKGFQLAAGLLSHSGVNEKALTAVRGQLPADVVKGFDTALKTQEGNVAWLKNVTSAPLSAPSSTAAALQQLAKLTPEDQKRLVAMQQLSQLTPDQQKQLVAAAAAKAAPATHGPVLKDPVQRVAAAPVAPPKAAPAAPAPVTPAAVPAVRVAAYAPYPRVGALSGCGGPEPKWGPPITGMSGAMEWAGRSAVHGSKGQPRKVDAPDGTTYLFSIENGVLTARPAVAA